MSEGKKEILLGDCLELMKDIPNGSIDMILADLPYGTTNIKWDAVIPYSLLWEQYNRIAKEKAPIVLFGSEPFSSHLRLSNLKNYKYDWIWEKNIPTGTLIAKRQPMRKYETISVFYKKQCTYNRQMIKRTKEEFKAAYRKNDSTKGISEHYTSGKVRQSTERQWYKPPFNILRYNSDKKRDGKGHPTQKPVALFEYLIKTYTNEGDLVLDNVAGSGTTAIACLKTNRQFIVMEKEQKYYDIILKRVGDFNKNSEQLTLFRNEL